MLKDNIRPRHSLVIALPPGKRYRSILPPYHQTTEQLLILKLRDYLTNPQHSTPKLFFFLCSIKGTILHISQFVFVLLVFYLFIYFLTEILQSTKYLSVLDFLFSP